MIANYHTHTYRCGHAEGNEGEYVKEAVKAGLKILGFSDHTPYDFFDIGPRNRPMRMKPEELPGYVQSLKNLRAEYRDRLEILIGVEVEYYPKYFPRLKEILKANNIEYIILGQHFLNNEVDGPYCGAPTGDEAVLAQYVSQSAEALHTRMFTYFAHPDLIHFTGSDKIYKKHMRVLAAEAKKSGTPLEINLLGLSERRNYPAERFWEIAAEEGNTVVLGCDAHRPEGLSVPQAEEEAREMAERLGLKLVETVPVRRLKDINFTLL